MLRKARLADGTRLGDPVAGPQSVHRAVGDLAPLLGEIRIGGAPSASGAREILHTMLLRDLCGMTWRAVGDATGVSASAARERYRRHRAELATRDDYARAAVETARRAVKAFLEH
jgi:hypothetical protein